jgi:hypothetical protein
MNPARPLNLFLPPLVGRGWHTTKFCVRIFDFLQPYFPQNLSFPGDLSVSLASTSANGPLVRVSESGRRFVQPRRPFFKPW